MSGPALGRCACICSTQSHKPIATVKAYFNVLTDRSTASLFIFLLDREV